VAQQKPLLREKEPPPIEDPYVFIYYPYNSNELSGEAIGLLNRLAATIKNKPNTRLDIKGYTDTSGTLSYNLKLSEFRANVVKSYLVGKGVNPLNMTTKGMGPRSSSAPDYLKQNMRSALRVEIELIDNGT